MDENKNMHPASGNVVTLDGEIVNLVSLLGGGTPVSDEVYDLSKFSPRSGLILGEDGKPYDLVSLLQNVNHKVPKVYVFSITEDMCTVTTDDTKGVAPYSTSYAYTNITIDPEKLGVSDWFEGMILVFVIVSKLVVTSSYRNVRVRIGDGGRWIPCEEPAGGISGGTSYFVKSAQHFWVYSEKYVATGALHHNTDTNTTYAYLVNTVPGNTMKVDPKGYGARYSLAFATTPLSNENGIVVDERWSSLVASSATGSTKKAVVPESGKFYIDRHPQYLYSANIAAGSTGSSATYQDYVGVDLRYCANVSSEHISTVKKVFLWLKNFNPEDKSFESDAALGSIVSLDKISTKFPNTVTGDIYLYWLGWTGSTYYSLTPVFSGVNKIFKYTPATGKMEACNILGG